MPVCGRRAVRVRQQRSVARRHNRRVLSVDQGEPARQHHGRILERDGLTTVSAAEETDPPHRSSVVGSRVAERALAAAGFEKLSTISQATAAALVAQVKHMTLGTAENVIGVAKESLRQRAEEVLLGLV